MERSSSMPGISYLIDFENVHDGGLSGIHSLNEEDCVYILYTENANKLILDYLLDIRVPFVVKKVANGKQSLDMHLVSFLGYLIGCEPDEGRQYAIVSHDTDFDNVCQFWCNQFQENNKVIRCPSIKWGNRCFDDSNAPMICDKWIDPFIQEQLGKQILRVIRQHGQRNRNNTYCINLSQLCCAVNDSTIYQVCRNQTGMKAQALLENFFASIVTVRIKDSTIWVYDVPDTELLNRQRQAEAACEEEASMPTPAYTASDKEGICEEPIESINEENLVESMEDDSWLEPVELDLKDPFMDTAPCCDIVPVTEDSNAEAVEDIVDPPSDEIKKNPVSIITEHMLALGMNEKDVSDIAGWVVPLLSSRTGKRAIYLETLTRYGLRPGLLLYAKIREALEEADVPGGNCFAKSRSVLPSRFPDSL